MPRNANGSGYARPDFRLKVCPFCGMPAEFKWDRKGRAYHSCGFCQTKLFIYGTTGFCGLELVQGMIARDGGVRFRQLVQRSLAQKSRRVRLP